jgi:hypothetical protein
MAEGDIDITGWTEERILRWEVEHESFATEARANAAADAWERENLTPEVLAESERYRDEFNEEATHGSGRE